MKIPNQLDSLVRRGYAWLHWPRGVADLQEVSYGDEFSDRRFLVIRRYASSYAGLLSFVTTNLGWIRQAVKNGQIPVVDMQTALNQCLEISEVGKKNAWEFYFEQPAGVSLADIARAKNVTVAHATIAPGFVSLQQLVASPELAAEMRALAQKYIRIRQSALAEFDNPELEAALADSSVKVIGVRARGTDFNVVKPKGHHIQPGAGDFIAKIEEFPSTYPIYLVSEDRSIIEPMKRQFGSRLILSRQEIPDYQGGSMPDCRTKGMTRRQEGAGYLKAIYDLSRCPILLAGVNNGTHVAYLLSKGFEHFHLFSLGTYA